MANSIQELLNALKPKEEEQLFSPMNPTQEQLASIKEQQQVPELETQAPVQAVMKQPSPKKDQSSTNPFMEGVDFDSAMAKLPKKDANSNQDTDSTSSETPLSAKEKLMQEYLQLSGKDNEELKQARERDRMLKIGGSIGDALATYLNAQSQMRVKAPGVQVQQGAGLGKVADLFATAPEIESDVKARREALMNQYKQLAMEEIAKEKRDSAAKIAEERNKTTLQAAGIRASKGDQNLDLRKQQYAQLGDAQVEKLSVLKSGLDQAGTLLPQLEKARKSLGIINTPLAELESKFGKNPEFQKLQQNYAALRNTIRKDIFGATLTPGEAEEFDKQLAKIGISDKNLEVSIKGLIDQTKLKARSRLNTIAETQPLKAETARNAIKSFGLEEQQLPAVDFESKINNVLKSKKNAGATRQQVIDALIKQKKLPQGYK